MKVFEELQARGMLAQTTGDDEVRELVNNGRAVFYIGYDPTADSLTAGHYMTLILMRHLQQAGNKPIVLIGGGTTMVGDPSGRTDLRKMLTTEQIDANAERIRTQMERFIDFSDGKAIMLNNAEWLRPLNYVEFLRDVGVHFSVNRMLTAECYKRRLESGLSFIEFNYMIMQSYDFLYLHEHYGCNMQCGGNDQWSNMLGGTELIRRKLGHDAHTLTINLLLTATGEKMGKTAAGALWLDPQRTSPYDFFQYFRNTHDDDVVKYLRIMTFLPLDEIERCEALCGSELNAVKERLAFEITRMVHGEEEAQKALDASRALFGGGTGGANMPEALLCASDFNDGLITIAELTVKSGLVPSRSEARRLCEQGGLEIDGKKPASVQETLSTDCFPVVLKKGKKVFLRVKLQ